MFLNEEEQSKISKSKSSISRKKRRHKKKSYFYKICRPPNDVNNEEKVSATEHSIILNDYQEELKFLGLKRENETQNKKDNVIICVKNKKSYKKIFKKEKPKKKIKKNNKINEEERIMKMSQLFNLYHNLFIKSGLESTKPCRFVDYLSNEIHSNGNNSSCKDNYYKITYENIKKLISDLPSKEPENILINKIVKYYFRCNFDGNIVEKLIKKINGMLLEQNKNLEPKNIENLNEFNDNISISVNNDTNDRSSKAKKDKFSYCNLLSEKLKNNNYQSCLSMTNDLDYFKSIIYINNKYFKNNNNAQPLENDVLMALEENKNLLNSFKDKNKEKAEQIDKIYLNNILKSKKIRKYINNKLFFVKDNLTDNIFKLLDKNNLNKILSLLINYKKEEKTKLEIINDLSDSEKINKDEISVFIILLCFIGGITLIQSIPNAAIKSDLTLINQLYQYCKKKLIYNLKHKNKKKLKTSKLKETNKIKIENSYQDSVNDNSISLVEERKIEEGNKIENNKIIKIILNNNDITLNYENKEAKFARNTNEFFPLAFKSENKEDLGKNNKKYIDENFGQNFIICKDKYHTNKSKENNKMNNFQKNILNELSLGNDIFKINYIKLRQKKPKTKEIYEAISKSKINIEINDDDITTIKNESKKESYNENKSNIVLKEGNKIIIFAD